MTGLRRVEDVIGSYNGRARTVLQYSTVTKRLVDEAKKPGFSADSWKPLAELVAVDEFERIGAFKEVMTWRDYVEFLTNWATSSQWECSFKNITESGGRVFLELEERSEIGDFSSVVNSLSVYEFTGDDRIRHIDIYLQMTPPQPEMLKSFEGVELPQ
ncbi:hypothetical protein [Mycobacterium marseillense]|uniref:SnoaL-like domain-containing protein n=1 Tax=Mycobacterium marseillense TaxID=701042 RepID=A0ABM7JI03_9MYCO|nr:hypothetical protein [Mycobacterium marseillense]MCV7406673.1 hypothetical protein [Mycobacterium marseillense]MDM3973990.1 hypothetical protein [Mycobacterium marseillense]ORA96184.1 hypothetical protein BST31_00945 [Mycobacterium marseillense]BBY13564.1 hypothetical protein MMARJ_43040 [Mycobacterium marseillense]